MKSVILFLLATTWPMSVAAKMNLRGGSASHDSQVPLDRILAPKANAPKTEPKPKNPKTEPKPKTTVCPVDAGGKTVTICHKNGGSFETIIIKNKDLKKHIQKNPVDTCGACIPKVDPRICQLLGSNTACTEPFDGFFQSLADRGTVNVAGITEDKLMAWFKDTYWASLSIEAVLEAVPDKYLVASWEVPPTFVGEPRLRQFVNFLLSGGRLNKDNLPALQGEFGFVFTGRQLTENNERALATSEEDCKSKLAEKVVEALILSLEAIGIDRAIAQNLVHRVVLANTAILQSQFATQFIQNDASVTEDFISSLVIVFLSTAGWTDVEAAINDLFADAIERVEAFTKIWNIFLVDVYMTGGWNLVPKLKGAMPSILSVFDQADIDVLNNDCFGDTIVKGCEDFYNSGGEGLTTSTVNMGQTSGKGTLSYDMYGIPDEIDVFYEGQRVYGSGGLVSGTGQADITFGPGSSQLLVVRVNATNSGTAWEFSLTCPTSGPPPGQQFDITYNSIKSFMEGKKYKFYTGTYNLNLVGIRSASRDGDAFDDTLLVLYNDEAGAEQIVKFQEKFTSDPGVFYRRNPIQDTPGVAIVVPGQYSSLYTIGIHNPSGVKGKGYEALVQSGPISVYRDNNKDDTLNMDPSVTIQTGSNFGINLHHGWGSLNVGGNSAGCQVLQFEADLKTVLDLAKKQIAAGIPGVFTYTLLDEIELRGSTPLPPTGTLDVVSRQLTTLGEGAIYEVYWPGTAASGVTLGVGYDLGSRTKPDVEAALIAAGMTAAQATKISPGASLQGSGAQAWVAANKANVGLIDKTVVDNLFKTIFPTYRAAAKSMATDTVPTPGTEKLNAASREEMGGVPLYTYVMREEEWGLLHPAMVELLADLKFHGGFYAYDRVRDINLLLKANDGNHLEQFKAVATLFGSPPPPGGALSSMDQYAKNIGLTMGNQENFYGIAPNDIRGATERRNRIRLSYLLQIINALAGGKTVNLLE